MDSIGDNVMAIICVVVGVLIIGCALVPIVDNASTIEKETEIVETTSGNNTLTASNAWIGKVDSINITSDGTSITINGDAYDGTTFTTIKSSVVASLAFINTSNYRLAITPALDSSLDANLYLASGSIVYDGTTLTVTGTTLGTPTTYSISSDFSSIWAQVPTKYFAEDETKWYGISQSPITIGEGQYCISSNGNTIIDTSTTTLPSNVSMVSNPDRTATLTFSSGNWYGPNEWNGYTTTTETTTSESEYAGLYNMIPVLCILGMAYVLIRRFY